MSKKRKTEQLAEAAIPVGLQFGATALAAGTGPVTALLLASVAPTASLLVTWSDERSARRLRTFLEAFLEGKGKVDAAEAEAKLREAGEDPRARELILEALRAVGDALAEVVVPPLGRLVRTYAQAKRGPDVFFRGMRRLLTDLSDDEFEALRDFVRRADGVRFAGEHPMNLELLYAKTKDGPEAQLHATRRWIEEPPVEHGLPLASARGPSPEQKIERIGLGSIDFAARLFNLLKVNGLAETGLGLFGASDSVQLLIAVEDLRRIRSLLEV